MDGMSIGSTGMPIQRFKIYGERNSGTNYAAQLVSRNFPNLKQHIWYPWEKHQFVHVPYILPGTLAVVVVRNAHDWFKSMYRNPHQIGAWAYDVDFHEFLKHEWSCRTNGLILNMPPKKAGLSKDDELMLDRHPVTGQRIENIVALRGLKVRSYMKVRHIFSDHIIVQYELLRDKPEVFVKAIEGKFDLQSDGLKKISRNVSRDGVGNDASLAAGRSEGLFYSEKDIDFINRTLDRDAEASVGYQYNPQFDLTP
ncbi:MAG: hypothetical protein ABNH38_08155 [Tateyamaria sp.]|jgi:hypothetical protein|uniref:hypothetical protein n=1 Tax=Tateyamaria sp. TaxID=1929288 RepID=UPI0032DDE775